MTPSEFKQYVQNSANLPILTEFDRGYQAACRMMLFRMGEREMEMTWISTKERLPELRFDSEVEEYRRTVNVCDVDGVVFSAARVQYGPNDVARWELNGNLCGNKITHWQPLPEPPQG